MAEFRTNGAYICECCGASLVDGVSFDGGVVCSACGTPNIVIRPGEGEEEVREAYGFLKRGEFASAVAAFEELASRRADDPQVAFGSALARFRVQLIYDPASKSADKLRPLCSYPSKERFGEDRDYLRAIEFATEDERKIYRERAREIDRIGELFAEKEKAGERYDVFFCLKVSQFRPDSGDKRFTDDVVCAGELYHQLVRDGYRVFYSRECLADKTGADYEAEISYALSHSSCMFVFASDPAYLDTRWVRSEYTRYYRLIELGRAGKESLTIIDLRGDRKHPIERLSGIEYTFQAILREEYFSY
ncbi:MAG: toll/interleukin-1 receptor domain-containing protein, partial [Christensenellaceae bacterium]